MATEVVDFGKLVKHSRWDGSTILETKNCLDCPYQRLAADNERFYKLCVWGVAWKIISDTDNPLSCQKIDKVQPIGGGRLRIKE